MKVLVPAISILLLLTSVAGAEWTQRSAPVLTGQFQIASDPVVLHNADGSYRMYYTGLDAAVSRTVICAADSTDGLTWKPIDTAGNVVGMVLHGRASDWDQNLETVGVVDRGGDGILLLYTGYRDEGKPLKGFPSSIGVASSNDGRRFNFIATALEPTRDGFDNDGLYHPCIVRDGDHWLMAYTGHCYTADPASGKIGVRILGATSTDGLHWQKLPAPLLSTQATLDWTKDGVAEPSLLRGPDARWYLFFTGLKDEERVIGVARSDAATGPWTVLPKPIITPTPGAFDGHQVIAPCVLIEKGKARMWYTAADGHEHLAVGYAEAKWPIWAGDQP